MNSVPKIQSAIRVIPQIYAYTTLNVSYQNGYIKIGYTEQDVQKRILQQTQTAGIKAKREWQGDAIFEEKGDRFTDHDFHAYLRKNGILQPQDLKNKDFPENGRNEWFHTTSQESKKLFDEFRKNRGITKTKDKAIPYVLRSEQREAIAITKRYYDTSDKKKEFLWNAKPRFGKTLTVYDFCKQIKAEKILIVTNRPAIANSWFSDYAKFLGSESGYYFVSEVDSLKGKNGVLSREDYANLDEVEAKFIEFVSLQDLKGSKYFGGHYDKLREVRDITWDILVIDEAHEGVDTYKTDVAFDNIHQKFTLHLSGTPFKALANEKFDSDAIFNYTYADEQKRKRDWDYSLGENPYLPLPKLNLYTYQMSEIIRDEISQGIEIDGETEEYAFDLNEFFSVNKNGKFIHESSVDKFLDSLTEKKKFPFSTAELRDELKHTFWFLDRVDSAKAMAKKLKEHKIFRDYEIVLAAGDGKIDDDDENKKSYDKVVEAIKKYDKTITLSVGQLTTGITIPEWTAVLMLCNVKSPALYMQAAFRCQNPCLFKVGNEFKRKENGYVFDFDPARTLIIFEKFANDLSVKTVSGGGDVETRKKNVCELLNFFPVIGEDENGELIELDAEKVLTIPRKIKSVEVVRRGFMSNFLFQNIHNIFSASSDILDIINRFEAVEEPKNYLQEGLGDDLSLDENGNIALDDEFINNKTKEIFGEKIYGVNQIDTFVDVLYDKPIEKDVINEAKNILKSDVKYIIDTVNKNYGSDIKPNVKKQLEKKLFNEADNMINKSWDNYKTEIACIKNDLEKAIQSKEETGKTEKEIKLEFEEKIEIAGNNFKNDLENKVNDFISDSKQEVIKTVDTDIQERKKDKKEEEIRDHLRGFSRTIPSFLMAYGNENVTLENFDKIVPDNVFQEVTGITLDEFRLLRDGGVCNGKEFDGQIFDSIVFNDSVKEFLALKKKLANYFDENSTEDIFDYILPQKTNQIFTPKKVVKKMVDMLEEENPNCFDDPNKTFIDLYMKSGLYIAEIVKRLYKSKKMRDIFPDKMERLKHIFEKQVFGLAPTEIIYKIATNYILGFDENLDIKKYNFRHLNTLPYAKNGTLNNYLEFLF